MKSLEEKLLEIFKKSDRAISPDTLSFITNSDPDDISRKLSSFEKFGIIKPVTEKRIRFFKLNRKGVV